MMSIRDEYVTNTTTHPPEQEDQSEESFPSRTNMESGTSTGSVNRYEESSGYVPHWEGYQGTYSQSGNTVRAAAFGGLAGGIFFFGLAAAILSGHFWPVFLVTLAMCSLVGSLSNSKAQAIYAGFQGCVFFLGLAVCSIVGFWPWVLVVLGIAAILGSLNGLLAIRPVVKPGLIVEQFYTAIRDQDYGRAYRFLDSSLIASINQWQFTQMAKAREEAEGAIIKYSVAPDLAVATTPLPGEPLPLLTFKRHPAENVIVQVVRTNGRAYPVHLQVRRVGKGWKIIAFDRI
jgi:hypothetical protein